jgi:hypothetical protein
MQQRTSHGLLVFLRGLGFMVLGTFLLVVVLSLTYGPKEIETINISDVPTPYNVSGFLDLYNPTFLTICEVKENSVVLIQISDFRSDKNASLFNTEYANKGFLYLRLYDPMVSKENERETEEYANGSWTLYFKAKYSGNYTLEFVIPGYMQSQMRHFHIQYFVESSHPLANAAPYRTTQSIGEGDVHSFVIQNVHKNDQVLIAVGKPMANLTAAYAFFSQVLYPSGNTFKENSSPEWLPNPVEYTFRAEVGGDYVLTVRLVESSSYNASSHGLAYDIEASHEIVPSGK